MKVMTSILELKFREEILIPGIENKISIETRFLLHYLSKHQKYFGSYLPEKNKVKIKVLIILID